MADQINPEFLAKYRDALYGRMYSGDTSGTLQNLAAHANDKIDPSNWSGESFNPYGGMRGQWSSFNTQVTQQLLSELYPNATQEQLDAAAVQAFYDPETAHKYGAGYSEDINPITLVKTISKYMGGVTPEQQKYLDTLKPKFDEQANQFRSGRNNEDDADSGLGTLGGLAVAALSGGVLAPALGLGAIGTGALAGGLGGLASTGDITTGLKGAAIGGLGGFAADKLGFTNTGNNMADEFTLDESMLDPNWTPPGLGGGDASMTWEDYVRQITENDPAVAEKIAAGTAAGSFSLKDLYDGAKALIKSGAAKDIGSAIATMVGQNAVDKSVGKDIGQMFDRIQSSNPFAGDKNLISAVKGNITNPLGKQFLGDLYGRAGEFVNPYSGAATTGFNRASSLVSDPMQHAGYGLATTAARGLQDLYTNPMGNPLMQAVSRLTAENAARKSAAGRGLQAGSMPAEMQDALMAALASNYANIANPMNQSVNAGSNWYQGDVTGATNLGSSAASANAQAANTLANLVGAGTAGMNASTNAAQVGGNLSTAHLAAMGQLANQALPYSIMTNPTRANIASAGQGAGEQSTIDRLGNLVTNKIAGSAVNRGLDYLGSLF